MDKATLSKVKIQKSPESVKKYDLYSQNTKLLGFLPTFFVVFLVLCGAFFASWRFGVFKIPTSDTKQSPATLVSQTNDNNSINAAQTVENQSIISQKYYTNPNKLRVHKNQIQECLLNYSTTPTVSINLAVSYSEQGFWLPKTCSEKTLEMIQVVRLNDVEIKTAENALGKDNVQILDSSNKTYAVAYTSDKSPTAYKLLTFVKGLTLPIFKDKVYLDQSNVFDTKTMEDKTYYLEGGCQNGGVNSCKLWSVDNFSGEVNLLQENAALSGQGQENQLQPGWVLRFAKKQDLVQGLNFTLVNEKNTPILSFKLIQLDINSLVTISTQDIKLGEQGYRDYYR